MPDKWTTASARKEFLRRERLILNKHRMEQEEPTDTLDLVQKFLAQNNQMTTKGMPITGEEMAQ